MTATRYRDNSATECRTCRCSVRHTAPCTAIAAAAAAGGRDDDDAQKTLAGRPGRAHAASLARLDSIVHRGRRDCTGAVRDKIQSDSQVPRPAHASHLSSLQFTPCTTPAGKDTSTTGRSPPQVSFIGPCSRVLFWEALKSQVLENASTEKVSTKRRISSERKIRVRVGPQGWKTEVRTGPQGWKTQVGLRET